VRATILVWSTVSGLILGLFAGILLFAVPVVGAELASGVVPRITPRVRVTLAIVSFAVLPLAGAVLGLLEGRLKLR
jgi:hypothetical protein